MRRVNGWEHRLDAYLADRAHKPFEWGTHDCCRFACGGLVAQGLPDPMDGLRPYKSARGAAGRIARLGGSLDAAADTLASKTGLMEVAPAFAQRGCVVMADIEMPDGATAPALGLVGMDGQRAWFAGPDGLVWRRLVDCRRAWGVG